MSVNLNLNERVVSKVVLNDNNKHKRSIRNLFKKKRKDIKPLSTAITPPKIKVKRKINKKKLILSIILVIVFIFLGVFSVLYYKADQFFRTTGLNVTPLETILFILGQRTDGNGNGNGNGNTTGPKPELKKDESGKYTNFLIVGVDSRQDRSSTNTDTMLVASYNYETNSANMYSIPRDLMVEIPGYGNYGKINSVYIYSELAEENSGMNNLQKTIEELFNLKIQYYVMIDFAGFTKVIDILDGITIDVENSFTDCEYPWEGEPKDTSLMGTVCYSQATYGKWGSLATYEPIKFEKGLQTMNGTTALKYARSRHSVDNMEGSDFARGRRQQKVVEGVKNKILSSETLSSPQKIIDIIGAIQDNVRFSGYTIDDIEAGLDMMSKAKDAPIYSFVLDPSIAGFSILTENNVIENGYAIKPVKGFGDYSDLHTYIGLTMKNPGLYAHNPNIRMFDAGIGYQAGYDKTMSMIDQYPYVNFFYVGTVKYAAEGNVVYKVDPSANVPSLQAVADAFDAKVIEKPAGISVNTYGVDIVVLLGKPPIPIVEETNTATEATPNN